MENRSTPQYWRARAEEARARADAMTDQQNRETLLRIAQDYDLLARRAEQQEPSVRPMGNF
jgi:hypothetical protein